MADFQLTNKRILILSPQDWGRMMLSKHHYARELAKRGNTVYFLNPPQLGGYTLGGQVTEVKQDAAVSNLFIVSHKVNVPIQVKFHAESFFKMIMNRHVKRLVKKLGRPDIIWSFDLNNNYPLPFFDADIIKVFHPVDEPQNPRAIASGEGASVIFSVTPEILNKYAHLDVPKKHILHGVTDEFLAALRNASMPRQNGKIQVGYSGNFLRPDMDHAVFLQIIRENPEVQFHCWGSYKAGDSNVGGGQGISNEVTNFVQQLQDMPNVKMYGVVASNTLAQHLASMNAFMICYDINKDQSKGTNYHKIMEYVATGKVVISNNVTNYKDRPDLVQMPASRENNKELPQLFKQVINNLAEYNSEQLRSTRMQYAADNTYSKHLDEIEAVLQKLSP